VIRVGREPEEPVPVSGGSKTKGEGLVSFGAVHTSGTTLPEANENKGAKTAKPMQLERLERSASHSSPVWKGDFRGIIR
jgi:hypothetical protein